MSVKLNFRPKPVAWTGGHRAQLRELSKLVNAEIRQARELVEKVR